MPYNGSGVYSPPGADFPAVTQTVISSTHFNNVINDIATALSIALPRDGQGTVTGNIPFGGFRATNVGITGVAGSVGTPAINVSDAGTGLYRSAASELAVTVAGTQRARFDATGLIVTGVATVSGVLTASTSVVTPLVGTDTNVDLVFKANGANKWGISAVGNNIYPTSDGTQNIGAPTLRVGTLFSTIIDSGTTGALALKVENGTTVVSLSRNGATNVNFLTINSNITGDGPLLSATGTDSNIRMVYSSKGTASHDFYSDTFGALQFQVIRTATAVRNVTVTGAAAGGNPTIGVSAGSLAITSAVVMASTLSAVGVTSTGDIVASAARLRSSEGAALTAAANLVLGTDGNLFQVTGNTQINLISNAGWSTNSGLIHLVFGGTPTVKHNQAASGANRPIILQGAVDLVATATTILSLAFSSLSNSWFEVARKT